MGNIMNFINNEDKDIFFQNLPDANTVDLDSYSKLYDVINNLPINYRIIITLKYFKDYSEKEIAEILNIPLGTVKSRLHIAKDLLKCSLE